MGYQESYVRMMDSRDFDTLVEVIRKNGPDCFDKYNFEPVEIITLLKPISGNLSHMCRPDETYSFEAGERFVYVTGNRGGQRSPAQFFEGCKNVPQKLKWQLQIIFTECFPSSEIFADNSELAKHEEFEWEQKE